MSNPDNVARLHEIKRLLDRIQQLPHIAAGAGNGVHNGHYPEPSRPSFYPEPPPSPPYPEPPPLSPPYPELPPPPTETEAEPTHRVAAVRPIGPLNVREAFGDESRALVPVPAASAVGINPWLFVTATAVNTIIAAVLAVIITLGVTRRDQGPGEAEPVAQAGKRYRPAAARENAEPAPVRPIELLAVGSPGEPLRLEALKPSRLPLQVLPEEAMQATYILVVTGLPANAALSGGTRMGSDSWLLPPGALRQLEIILPEWSASVIELGVELRHVNGAVAAQAKAWLAVPPPPVPQNAKLDQAAIKDLLQSGDRQLSRGDVAAARAIYERAAALGSAQAAFALGSTYDPSRLWSLGVFGMVGNKERARHWYQRADQLGHPEAKARLRGVKN
jgi:TPR repeat protein